MTEVTSEKSLRGVAEVPVKKFGRQMSADGNSARSSSESVMDQVALEEPLEIRLDFVDQNSGEAAVGKRTQKSVSMTMRTPGHDFDLAVGFLFTEGIIENRKDVIQTSYCGKIVPYLGHSNTVKVELADDIEVKMKSLDRNFYMTSSCGVCGKASVDALKTQNRFTRAIAEVRQEAKIPADLVTKLPAKLRTAQKVFDSTGGLHASGIFSMNGDLICVREDVGRHNALDKVIGNLFLADQLPLNDSILVLSGRISFELVQKAAMAGLTMVVAVGAPSSLALDLAKQMRMTLIGFARDERFNVYCGEERLK